MIRWARRALASPSVYRLFSRLAGGHAARERFAREHIRAEPGDRVLDIGCGPAVILPHLGAVSYTGFDASAEYIETAKRTNGDRGTFHCRRVDEATLDEIGTFDVVLAIGVVHHLDDAEAESLFRLARRALRPGGRLVTFDPVLVEGQSPIARFLIKRDRGEYVRERSRYIELASRVFDDVQPVVRHDLNRVPYTLLVLECVA